MVYCTWFKSLPGAVARYTVSPCSFSTCGARGAPAVTSIPIAVTVATVATVTNKCRGPFFGPISGESLLRSSAPVLEGPTPAADGAGQINDPGACLLSAAVVGSRRCLNFAVSKIGLHCSLGEKQGGTNNKCSVKTETKMSQYMLR